MRNLIALVSCLAILAPGMAASYVLAALYILMVNFTEIPNGFALIFKTAFAPEPLVGGVAGSFLITLMWGIRRGLFSNEAAPRSLTPRPGRTSRSARVWWPRSSRSSTLW